MLNKVFYFMKSNHFNIDKPVVVATSGGADSVVLLHILHDLGYEVILAHVNHHKRPESEHEEERMRYLAESLGIPFELLSYHFDGVGNFHEESHHARYEFFRSVADKYHTDIIATAHHADDQAETILLKLMEGSNLYGYGGIAMINDDGLYRIIRPLLCVTKQEIYDYAEEKGYEYFEDSSNHQDEFLRNRLRHHVIPLLKEECPDLSNKVEEYSIMVHEAFDYIRKESRKYLDKTKNEIIYETFDELDIALKKDIISLLLERYNIRKNNNIILSILNISGSGTKMMDLNNNYVFIRSYEKGYLSKKNDSLPATVEIGEREAVIYDGRYRISFSKIKPLNNAKYINLCYNNLVFPLIAGPKKEGETISLNVGEKRVSRVLIDKKIPKELRNFIPVLRNGNGEVLWIYNLAKSKKVSMEKETGNIYLMVEELSHE